MRRPGPELIDRLAAEYVLGTLRGRARDRFERWIAERGDVREIVRAWEDRLVGLVAAGSALAPSARVWREIEMRLGLRTSGPARAQPSQVRRRWLALAAGVAAIGVAVLVAMFARTGDDRWQAAAVLAAEGSPAAAWRIDVARDGSELRARAEQPLPGGPATDYELWALPAGDGAPVSLGLLPRSGVAAVRLSARQQTALAAATRLAVSREPAGGSTTGLPTGPVVLVAPVAPPA